jgi:hypothetical protein
MHSYLSIVASHLDTLDVRGVDVKHEMLEPSQKMVYWWMHLEDERMDPDVHDQRKLLAKRVSSNQH